MALDRKGEAKWDHGFKETHSMISLESGELVMLEANLFKDGTNRDYSARYAFKRVQTPQEFKDPRVPQKAPQAPNQPKPIVPQ